MPEQTKCPACGTMLPTDRALCSISHSIAPGSYLCSDCGQRETADLAWVMGIRLGLARAAVCKPTEGEESDA